MKRYFKWTVGQLIRHLPVSSQQEHGLPFIASHPSRTIRGNSTNAATASAQLTFQTALMARPAKAINARYPHTADSAASALNAALPVATKSSLFCFASQGITTAARMSITIPTGLGRTSLYLSSVAAEAKATNAASAKSRPPAILAACCSSRSPLDCEKKRHNTTVAESISTALSPPKASSAGLCASKPLPMRPSLRCSSMQGLDSESRLCGYATPGRFSYVQQTYV